MAKPSKKNGKEEKTVSHNLHIDSTARELAYKMAGQDLQSFPKFITKLVNQEWERRNADKKVAA